MADPRGDMQATDSSAPSRPPSTRRSFPGVLLVLGSERGRLPELSGR